MVATAESRMLTPVIWYPGTVIGRNQARIVAEVECPLEWVADWRPSLGPRGYASYLDGTSTP